MVVQPDIIAAPATAPGKGAVGIIRVSGGQLKRLISGILGFMPEPRIAHLANFYDHDKSIIDKGIALYFPAPNSYNGENILELHGHGGKIVMDMLLRRVIELGARVALPGEFTERAFLNQKLDLTQAEGIADLIESDTEQAARCAQRSLQGQFSKKINDLKAILIELRSYIEASIDFVEEDIDFLSKGKVEDRLKKLYSTLQSLRHTAKQGCVLMEGMTIVLAGRPNAGKSSLLNRLSGNETAIVTEWEGTTRDVLRENIQIDGLPVHIVDTAGLRQTDDNIEKVGVERAYAAIRNADRILFVIDKVNPGEGEDTELLLSFPDNIEVTKVYNKIDLLGISPTILNSPDCTEIHLSAKTGQGMDLLRRHLTESVGYDRSAESIFTARRRHLEALLKTESQISNALNDLKENLGSEIIAEQLRLAQNELCQITGEFATDDLLGEIFSHFCIGK